MDHLFLHLEYKFKKPNDSQFIYRPTYLMINNCYYYLKVQKINEKHYEFVCVWKLGLLSLVFDRPYKTMQKIVEELQHYSRKNDIALSSLHYHKN